MERARVPRACFPTNLPVELIVDIESERGPSTFYPAQQIRQLDRRDRRVSAFVARLGAGTLDGLLDGVRRQHAERDRHAGVLRNSRETARTFTRNVIEVGRRTLDDG